MSTKRPWIGARIVTNLRRLRQENPDVRIFVLVITAILIVWAVRQLVGVADDIRVAHTQLSPEGDLTARLVTLFGGVFLPLIVLAVALDTERLPRSRWSFRQVIGALLATIIGLVYLLTGVIVMIF